MLQIYSQVSLLCAFVFVKFVLYTDIIVATVRYMHVVVILVIFNVIVILFCEHCKTLFCHTCF